MRCATVSIGDGMTAIVCGQFDVKQCSGCHRPATLLCDFKVSEGDPPRTCDAPLCDVCSFHPAPGKDICGPHSAAARAWLQRQAARRERTR